MGAFLFWGLGRLRGEATWRCRLRGCRYEEKKIRVCPSRSIFCALRAWGLFFSVAWAACAAGGRWGPVRGCRPSEAPSALPPDDPAGLVAYLHSHGLALRGFPYAVIPRGLRGFCSGSFLAALGDLPARRAMPPCVNTLNESPGDIWLAGEVPKDSGLAWFFVAFKKSRLSMPPQKSAKQTKHITCTVSQAGSVLLPGAVL